VELELVVQLEELVEQLSTLIFLLLEVAEEVL
jgi:hypothetical protein